MRLRKDFSALDVLPWAWYAVRTMKAREAEPQKLPGTVLGRNFPNTSLAFFLSLLDRRDGEEVAMTQEQGGDDPLW